LIAEFLREDAHPTRNEQSGITPEQVELPELGLLRRGAVNIPFANKSSAVR
jgi:hypothetical protein